MSYVLYGIGVAVILWVLEIVIRDGVERGIKKSLGDLQSTIQEAVAAGIEQAKQDEE